MVILLPYPALGGEVGGADEFEQGLAIGDGRGDFLGVEHRALWRLDIGAVIERGFVAEFFNRQIGHHLAFVFHHKAQRVGCLADNREIEAPFDENRLGLFFFCRIKHHEHALLAFRQHHLVSRHAFFAAGDFIEIEFNPEIALGAHFNGGGGKASSAHVLNGDDRTRLHQLKAGL